MDSTKKANENTRQAIRFEAMQAAKDAARRVYVATVSAIGSTLYAERLFSAEQLNQKAREVTDAAVSQSVGKLSGEVYEDGREVGYLLDNGWKLYEVAQETETYLKTLPASPDRDTVLLSLGNVLMLIRTAR